MVLAGVCGDQPPGACGSRVLAAQSLAQTGSQAGGQAGSQAHLNHACIGLPTVSEDVSGGSGMSTPSSRVYFLLPLAQDTCSLPGDKQGKAGTGLSELRLASCSGSGLC